jgi:hypothetical protein
MRKVCSTDERLEGLVAGFRAHLDRCASECESILASRGMVSALQSPAARSVAQYGLVVERLSSVDDCAAALGSEAIRVVSEIREGVDEWRMLANATILEALAQCVEES